MYGRKILTKTTYFLLLFSKISSRCKLIQLIAPPAIRRSVQADRERTKITKDSRHPMHGTETNNFRLKSRNSVLKKKKRNA